MDDEARNIIASTYKRTESILLQHRHMLEKVQQHENVNTPVFFYWCELYLDGRGVAS